ncbi:LuxR C-terminal-related transcriptional regulator [Pseudogracilibacillus auburnensis]|uniref:Two-component system response regulator DegU n=1 Tax=Pseudogracilibacillus auburnensis TaxID=1494959 RepID=A0A2V3W9H2_9BACI|nr:response regulator transcription factor [Pseudogracilibacillus auburnensis]MBO1001952.1 response regulator transcription factor [Pseudogracilibacillus auburnensis]PXW90176.1 two-component system response regulator DegU [Pseudogracilibacillus auburnensis]
MKKADIHIAIIDQQQLFREGLKFLLEDEPFFNVFISSNDISIVQSLLPTTRIDVLLIDINIFMKHKMFIQEIIDLFPKIKIIALSSEEGENYVAEAIKHGVHGYLLKEMDPQSFIHTIHVVLKGESSIPQALTQELINEYRKLFEPEDEKDLVKVKKPLYLYTDREYDVLQLLANGKKNHDIAKILQISEQTVKHHVNNILKKMNVKGRTEAAVIAIRNNWVEI